MTDMLRHVVPLLFQPLNLMLMLLGLAGGIVVGGLPGLTATMAVALMVPITFGMDTTSGLIMLGAIYVGAIYGGSIPAVLVCTPGTPSSVATTFDGWPLCRAGKADEGLYASLISSACGGLFGTAALLLLAAPLARFSLRFGAPETFWLCVFGLSTIAVMSSGNGLKGVLPGLIGLLIATIGLDAGTGMSRFTFGTWALMEGVGIVPSMIGLFSLAQVLVLAGSHHPYVAEYSPSPGAFGRVLRRVLGSCKGALARSSLIGTLVGMLPGAGGEIASIVAYNESKRWDKEPDKYGTGAIEGLVSSEAANNAVIGGSLIPMLTLGIPGSAVAAVMLGALLAKGILPGFKVFASSGDLVYAFTLSQFLVNLLLLPVGYVLIKGLVRLIRVRLTYLALAIVALSFIGSYAVRNDLLDVRIVLAFGAIGYVCNRVGMDNGALALGIILGPIIDEKFGKCFQLAEASGSVAATFGQSPLCLAFIALTALSLLSPRLQARKRRRGAVGGQRAGGPQATAPAPGNARREDRLCASLCGLTALAFLLQMPEGGLAVRLYPLALCGLILLCCGLLVLRRAAPAGRAPDRGEERPDMRRVGLVAAGSAVYCGLIGVIGFYPASALFLLIMPGLLPEAKAKPGEHGSEARESLWARLPRFVKTAAFAAGFLLCVWTVFSFALNVPVPQGWQAL